MLRSLLRGKVDWKNKKINLRKILKHSEYQDEMILLFEQGLNYTQIAEHLIEKYNLDISAHWFRTTVRYFILNGS